MQENSGLRVVFAGTPTFAAAYLSTLRASPHRLVGVYTQPDRPAGRGKNLRASPVKALARQYSVPIFQPPSFRDAAAQQTLAELQPDVVVVVAYGLILPRAVLDIPRYGCLNVHASLLPRWRGAAPIQRAIEAGDRETGVTIMQMDAGLDTGDMFAKARCDIRDEDTAGSLFERLTELGKAPLLEVLGGLPKGEIQAEAQDESQATYASKIDKSEAAIDWSEAATTIDRKVRAFNPFPVAFSHLNDRRIKVHRARALGGEVDHADAGRIAKVDESGIIVHCGRGSLEMLELQLPGKRPMWVNDVLLGNRQLFTLGESFQ